MEMEKRYCKFCMSPLAGTGRACPFCGRAQEGEQPPHHLKPGTVLNKKFLVGAAIGEAVSASPISAGTWPLTCGWP